MYDHPIQEDLLYLMLYEAGTLISLIACCYLLLRRGNAFAPDITSPVRLRKWAAGLFAATTLSHLWYLPHNFLTSDDDEARFFLLGGLLDTMTVIPLAIVILLVMLQDRRRPLWPVAVMVLPLVIGMVLSVVYCSFAFLPILYAYLMLLGIGLAIYMLRALRQYGRWLRDNYADLEHKEVWQSFTVLGIFLLMFGIYAMSSKAPVYEYVLQLYNIALTCYLVWRVETLSDLGGEFGGGLKVEGGGREPSTLNQEPSTIHQKLQQNCVEAQLYLQHDLTLAQLAQAIGTNRYYLSQYFASQDMNYNAYINDLRINHFVTLYRDAIANLRPYTAQQLAHDSGYRSYSTFSLAFKQRMGQSVTAWMRDTARE